MKKGIFIVGTDTDIGKTFISALILKKLRLDGINAGYYKAVLSGAEIENGKLIPGDCKFVCEVSELDKDYEKMVSYTLKHPYSPHLASEVENVQISLSKIKNDFAYMNEKFEFLLCEGSGGIVCPISFGEEVIMLEDIVKMTGFDVVIVGRAGLGSINHTVMTVNYIKNLGINIKGIVLNNYDNCSEIHRDNKKIIERLTNIKSIVTIEKTSNIENLNLHDLGRMIYE